jgi:hypothetical protein
VSDEILRLRLMSFSRDFLISLTARLYPSLPARVTHRKQALVDGVLIAFRGDTSPFGRNRYEVFNTFVLFFTLSLLSLLTRYELSRPSLMNECLSRKYGPHFVDTLVSIRL